MQQPKRLWTAAVVTAVVGLGAQAHGALSSASASQVGFEAKGPAGFKIDGSTGDLTVSEIGGNVIVTVALGNLNTGIDLRDHHMKEKYLEVPKFPAAILAVPRSGLHMPGVGERIEADVQGALTLHGETRPVSVHYDAKSDGSATVAHGKFHINMNEFGINVPTYLGVTVKPDVDVSANFQVAGLP